MATKLSTHPLYVNLNKALKDMGRYPGSRTDRKVFAEIAQYVNGRGIAWPGMRTIAKKVGIDVADVGRSVHRLETLGFFRTFKARKEEGKFRQTIYIIPRRYLRSTPDKKSSHYLDATPEEESK